MSNLPAIDHRRRLRLWDKDGRDIVCFADERIPDDVKPVDAAAELLDGRTQASMTIDYGQGGWRTRRSWMVWRDSQGQLQAEDHREMLRYLTCPPNPFVYPETPTVLSSLGEL
jgi:hypothetical protein